MAIRTYHDFILVATDVSQDINGIHSFTIQLVESPMGTVEAESRTIPKGLMRRLGQLDRRKLNVNEIIDIGDRLADLLLGGEIGVRLSQCLSEVLEPEQGLRLLLRLSPELAGFPWEYIYRQRGGGEKDETGFLALDPRISITRQEILAPKIDLDNKPKSRRMLVALASPVDNERLELEKERENLQKAFQNSLTNIKLDFLEDATVEGLGKELRETVDILHFAGHGSFEETGQGESFGSVTGEGTILLIDHKGNSAPIPSSQIAVNLLGSDVQLVVLGACETGKRDAENVWSGVVAAVMEAEVPAAVAMQFSVWDDAAIEFARSFYQVLAAGLPLDYAVCEARRAIFNRCNPLRDHIDRGRYWRDWGVPVLYKQIDGDFLLPALIEPEQREAVELCYLGWDYAYNRDYERALDCFRQATWADPSFSDAFEGVVYLQQIQAMDDISRREYTTAIRKLTEALAAAKRTDPRDARALTLRGAVHKSLAQAAAGMGDREESRLQWARAGHFFEQALRLDPDDEGANLGQGNVQHNQRNLDAAIKWYLRAIELNPRYTAAYHDLALIYQRKIRADPANANDWCLKAIDAWQETVRLALHDPGFSKDYVAGVLQPRIDALKQECRGKP